MSISTQVSRLTTLRNTLRAKLVSLLGISPSADLEDCVDAVVGIPSKTSDDLTVSGATVTVPAGYYASQASKSIATGALLNPTINNSTGVVTAQVGTSGYLASGTSKTLSLTTQGAQTITPGTTDQTIAANRWLTGAQTIKGDANLVPGNIKSGVTIFGKTGTYSGDSPNLQSKSVTYTSNGSATVTPDSGYDGLSSVAVTVDVSGGGGVETCTLTIDVDKEPGGNNDACVYATAPDGAQTYSDAGTYTILKNSVLGAYFSYQVEGSYQMMLPHVYGSVEFYKATGNLTVHLVKNFDHSGGDN